MDTRLSADQEKALIGVLYNHASFATTLQVFGETAADNARIATLRSALELLLIKYGLIEALAPDVLLLMGLPKYISKSQLETWAAQDANKHLQLRAAYFLKNATE